MSPDGRQLYVGENSGNLGVAVAIFNRHLPSAAGGTTSSSTSYSGTTSQGYPVSVSVEAGVAAFKIFNSARCSDGGTTSGPSTLGDLRLDPSGRFSLHFSENNLQVVGSTDRYSLQDSLSGQISGGAAHGEFVAITTFRTAAGTYISTCKSGVLTWSAHKDARSVPAAALRLSSAATEGAASLVLTTPSVAGPNGPITVRERGFASHGENFVFVFLSPARTRCAATQEQERTLSQAHLVDSLTLPSGTFNHLDTGFRASPAPGLYRLCGYLSSIHGSTADPAGGPPDATATLVIGRQATSTPFHDAPPSPPAHTPLALTVTPNTIRDGYPVAVRASGYYTEWSELLVDVQESADPCGATSNAENNRVQDQADPYDASLIYKWLGNPDKPPSLPVSYFEPAYFTPDGPGPYRFCAYLLVSQAANPGEGPMDPPKATAQALLRISPNAVPQLAPLAGP